MSHISCYRLKLDLQSIFTKFKDRLDVLAFESPSTSPETFVNLDEENAQLQMIMLPLQTLPYLKSEIRIELFFNIATSLMFIFYFPTQFSACFECDNFLSSWLIILTLLNAIGILPNILTLWKLSYYNIGMDPMMLVGVLYLVFKSNVYAYMSNLTHIKFFLYLVGTFRVWLLARKECADSYLLTISYILIASFFIRVFYSFIRFNLNFAGLGRTEENKNHNGFNEEEIAKGFDVAKYGEIGYMRQNSCSICMEDYQINDYIKKMKCVGEHWFHRECINQWLVENRTCPNCNFLMELEKKEN